MEQLCQAAAVDVLQSHVRMQVELADVVDLHNVRVVQASYGFRLGPEGAPAPAALACAPANTILRATRRCRLVCQAR